MSGNEQSGGQGPKHIPVLLEQTVELLAPKPGQTVLDCTAGRGGHAAEFAVHIGRGGTLVLFDHDPENLEAARKRVIERCGADVPRIVTHHASFADAPRRLMAEGLSADAVLADLGFSSTQMDDAARGFSFMREGPLDMRMNPGAAITAAELVNTMPERELAGLIAEFGEEPEARRVAAAIVTARSGAEGAIKTTSRLAEVIRQATRPRIRGNAGGSGGIDPATKTFQALRIAVNDELGSLEMLLSAVHRAATGAKDETQPTWLERGARVGIISFHSLEDRPVKRLFAELATKGLAEELSRKPVMPTEAQILENPRCRSAKLRVIRLLS